MLTQEQIKNLNPGDKLCCTCSFVETEDYGNRIVVDMCYAGSKERTTSRISYFYEQLSLPPTQPKHDPCRLFKNGDKVRVVEWNGRHFHDRDHGTELTTGCICEVCDDEESTVTEGYDNIVVIYQEQVRSIQPCFLELVTPVEELESFGVRYSTDRDCAEVYHRRYKNTVAAFYCKCGITREQAEKAAEAERDRLNAEYRKEQNND